MPETTPLSDQDWGLMPSDEDVRFYAEHGWYLSPKLLSDDEVDTLVEASERYYAGERDRKLPHHPAKLAYWTPADGDIQRNNDYIHYESDAIAAILRKPIIGATAARLAAVDLIRLFQATLLYKPPQPDEKSNIVPWHFDKYYWASCSSENMITAFIPFHLCDESMGTITMVDGSHRWEEFHGWDSRSGHAAVPGDQEREHLLAEASRRNGTEVVKLPITIPKGHMTFHHCRLYHGSGANLSDRPRRAISLHMQDGSNAYQDRRLATDSRQTTYKHDELVRRTANGAPDYSDPEYCPVLWQADPEG